MAPQQPPTQADLAPYQYAPAHFDGQVFRPPPYHAQQQYGPPSHPAQQVPQQVARQALMNRYSPNVVTNQQFDNVSPKE